MKEDIVFFKKGLAQELDEAIGSSTKHLLRMEQHISNLPQNRFKAHTSYDNDALWTEAERPIVAMIEGRGERERNIEGGRGRGKGREGRERNEVEERGEG